MALKDTVHKLKTLLHEVSRDLEKATDGNKAASQRVRTGTIKLERCAKCYRKESVAAEKKGARKQSPNRAAKKEGWWPCTAP